MKKFYILTIIFALLGISQAWAWPVSGSVTKQSDGKYYALYYTDEENFSTISEQQYTLSAPGAQLTYDAKCVPIKVVIEYWGGALRVAQSWDNGSSWSDELFSETPQKNTYSNFGPINIDKDANKIKLYTTTGATGKKYMKNVFVTMAQYVEAPSSTKVEFGEAYLNSATAEQTITVAWCNVPAMTFEVTGDDKAQFDVEVVNNAEEGKWNTATFTISYKHDVEGQHSAMLVIKDSYGNYNKSVILSGETKKHDNTIVWSVEEAWKDWNDQISLNATSDNSENTIQYAVSNEAYATITDGKVTFLEAGAGQEVKVTASQAESANYYAAQSVVKTFHIKRQQVLSWDDAVVNADMAIGAVRDITGYAVPQFATTETVTYSSANPDIISVEGNVLTANAVGTVEITASIAADEQNRATEIHKTFTVKEKESVIVKQGDAIIAQNSELVLHLGESSGEITSSNAKNTLQIVVEDESVARYNTETKKLEAVAVGETKVTLTQDAIDEYLAYANEITVKVELVENTLVVIAEAEKYVGEELTDFYTLGNNDAEITVESSDPTIALYQEGKIVIPNSEAKSFDETVVTLTVRQAQKGEIAGAEKTIALTVKKYENTIKVNGEASFSTTLMPGATLPIAITSDNAAKVETIECTQTAGENFVKIIEGVATTNYRTGTATWSVSQPEDYKYQAAEATFSIKVAYAAEDESKKLYIYESEANDNGWKCSTFGEKSWNRAGVAARLWFDAKKTVLWSRTITPKQSVNGVWSTADSEITGSLENGTFKNFSKTLDVNATAIKFEASHDDDIYVRNVKVEVNSHLLVNDFVIDAIPGDKATDYLRVQYGIRNGGDLKIASDNALFFFGADSAASYTIAGSDGKVGEALIPVHFVVPDEELQETANIVIYNGVYSNTIKIVVKVSKVTPEITADNVELAYGANVALAATVNVDTLDLNYEVTEGAEYIHIADGKIYADKVGTAKVRAYSDATLQYNAAEKEFVVTVNPAASVVTTAPVANELTYTGAEQVLIAAGEAEGGELKYSLDGENYSTNLPTGVDALTYIVYYKVFGDANHNDSEAAQLNVTIAKAASEVTTAPQAKTLTYNGEAQVLIEAGEAVGGEMQYSLDGENYSAELPTGTEAQAYVVYYKVVGDENHTDTEAQTINVTIGYPTGISDIEAGSKAKKILRDGQIYILRDGKVYNINGFEVRL